MNKILLTATLLLTGAMYANADITIKVNPTIGKTEFELQESYISDRVKPRMERPEPIMELFKVKNGKFTIKTLPAGSAQYYMPANEQESLVLYTEPGDNYTVELTSLQPLVYSVKGNQMMEDIANLDKKASEVFGFYRTLMESGNATPESIAKIEKDYEAIFTDFLTTHPDAIAVPYALMHLEGESFINGYQELSQKAKGSPLMPLLDQQYAYEKHRIESERKRIQMESGTYPAPNFTFQDLNGKDVSLSDYRGKWVVIDFWGTWCPWCIKGFPALKEAYATYQPQLEVIGVACNDTRDAWEAGVKKYSLPWINLFNPEQGGGKLLEDYAVEGFPTKVLVDPSGNIANITVGENPEFFQILKDKIK